MNQRERIEEYEALGAPKNRGQRLAELEKELKQAQTELTGSSTQNALSRTASSRK